MGVEVGFSASETAGKPRRAPARETHLLGALDCSSGNCLKSMALSFIAFNACHDLLR